MRFVFFFVTTALMLALDQLTKLAVVRTLREGRDTIDVIDGFMLIEHARNEGAAWSMLEGQLGLFAVFGVLALVMLVHMLWNLEDDQRLQAAALGMITAGVLGNSLDRLIHGSVTDFIRLYTHQPQVARFMEATIGSSAWPTFNVADVALIVGVIGAGIAMWLEQDDEDVEVDPPAVRIEG